MLLTSSQCPCVRVESTNAATRRGRQTALIHAKLRQHACPEAGNISRSSSCLCSKNSTDSALTDSEPSTQRTQTTQKYPCATLSRADPRSNTALKLLMSKQIGVIMGSTRPNCNCKPITSWVHQLIQQQPRCTGIAQRYEVVDLSLWNLPLFNEPGVPARDPPVHAHTKAWQEKIGSFSAFIFITPQVLSAEGTCSCRYASIPLMTS